MRWMLRFVILGLAGYGAYRLYELLQPRVADMRSTAETSAHRAADTARSAADDLRDDLRAASRQLQDDVSPVVDQVKETAQATVDDAAGAPRVSTP
jgi:hypothetical protein